MKQAVAVFYNEPIVFLGSLLGVLGVLAAVETIPVWIVPAATAIVVPIQRHFVSPVEGD